MTPLHNTVRKLLTPVIYANLAAMVVSGAWLVAKGGLSSIWPAVVGLVISPFLFPVLLLPGAVMAGIMNLATRSHPRLADFLTLSSVWYLVTLFDIYITCSVYFVSSFLTGTTFIPATIWAVAAGIAPWAIHASKDRDNLFFSALVMMAEIAAIIAVVIIHQWSLGFWLSLVVVWNILAAFVVLHSVYEARTLGK